MSIAENLTTIAENVPKVYEAGKKAWNKEIMDSYIDYFPSSREYMFGGAGWNYYNFYPTKNFTTPTKAFNGHNKNDKFPAYDLAQRLEECGVKMTMGHATSMFLGAKFTRLPELDFSPFGTYSLSQTFYGAEWLVTIDLLKLGNSRTAEINSSLFYNCKSLKNIKVDGLFNTSVSFSYSPLTVESMKSIITHLKDYSGTENAGEYTLTLKDSCKTLMAQQGAIAELGGKTYDAYIADIGWNLA